MLIEEVLRKVAMIPKLSVILMGELNRPRNTLAILVYVYAQKILDWGGILVFINCRCPVTETRYFSMKSLLKSPTLIFLLIALVVFVSEVAVMLLFYYLPKEPLVEGAITDATLLVIIISPALYFFLFRPMVVLIRERQKSELRFKTLAAGTSEGIAITAQDKILDVNDQLPRILGYERHELIGQHLMNFIPPEDRDRVMGNIQAEPANHTEHEMLCKDGSRIIVETHGQTIEQQGLPTRLIAIRDITERKQYEEEGRLAATLYAASSEAMVITDSWNSIISVNPAFTKITGYSADEVLGKNPRQLCSGLHDDTFYQKMLLSLATTNHWAGEVWDLKKSGEVYAVRISISAIPDDTGSGWRYVAQFSDITEKKRMEEIISKHANFDPLTKLPNRRLFHDRLNQEIKKSHRAHNSLALMFIDLDRFKDVNDTLGHDIGDKLLVEAARRIVASVRESDIVSRLGGDEFTVILCEVTDVNHIKNVAHGIIQSLSQPYKLGEAGWLLSASIGITVYPTDATHPDDLLKNADQAMYLSKSEGRNRFHFFTEEMQEATRKRHQMARDLHSALHGNQFLLYFQPIIDLKTGELFKAETLLRWQHPVRGMIGPTEFIAAAEEIGLIDEIGDWVFKESLEQGKRWAKFIDHAFQIGVKISPIQFLAKGHNNIWINHVHEMKLSGKCVSIEITEETLLNDPPGVAELLLAIHDAGMKVAIDNFGIGYSSLYSLQKFKIDYLKIDASFTRNLATGSTDLALYEAIIVMAHKLSMKVIAEGIETAEQCDLLVAAGCDFGQGYFFSRPVSSEEFEKLLQNRLDSEQPQLMN